VTAHVKDNFSNTCRVLAAMPPDTAGLVGLGTWTASLRGIAFGPLSLRGLTSLKNTVGGMKNTTVVTDAGVLGTPDNKDVIAATPAIVAAIKQAA